MAPPPDSTGDEFPDFDHMTPEEQMAWLESLARRQGARDDELTTAADLDIPVPEDAEVDEPGYVPFEGSRSGREWAVLHAEPESESPEAEEQADEEIEWVDLGDAAPQDEDDPMRWLGALAAQPGPEALDAEWSAQADQGEPQREEAPVEEPVEPEADIEFEPHAAAPWEMHEEEAPAEDAPAAARAALDSPFTWDAMDEEAPPQETFEPEPLPDAEPEFGLDAPLPWESLSEEQEAPAQETFEAEEPPVEAAPPPAPQTSAAPQPGAGPWDELEAVAEWEASLAAANDPLAGADPMTWLESLAKRQGVPDEELTTAADLEVPEPPEDVEIEEPGYVPYSALDILPTGQEVPEEIRAEAERLSAEAEEAELELSEDVLNWLHEIGQEPGQDAAEYLATEDSEAVQAVDPLAGLSDETIERLLARGELTGEQELAWLERQAARLVETRAGGEDEDAAALRAELPDWLQELRAADAGESPDVPDWLATLAEERRVRGESTGEPESAAELGAALESPGAAESELEAFVESGLVPDAGEFDPLAEALDEEYDGLLAGADREPDWYTDAVARAAAEETIAGEPVLAAAEPVDLPDWLIEAGEQGEAADDLPDWLSEVEEPAQADQADAPDWLVARARPTAEDEHPAEAPALGGWLEGLDRGEPAPLPPVKPEIPPAAVRRAPLPEGPPYEPYRQRLEQAPDDHPVRLELARSLRAHEALAQSLDQYEVLIEATKMLDDVTGDLQQLVERYHETPRVHRLLGDTYLRSGQLKDALDAYRAALERL